MKIPVRSLLAATTLAFVAPLFGESAAPVHSHEAVQSKPTDANIAAIVVAANDIDVAAGQLAIERATNPAVKGVGEMMVRDHQAVNQQAKELAAKLKLTPQDNDFSNQLRATAKKTMLDLGAKHGADFDRAYTANEVAYHQAVISVVDTMLLPAVKNPELKTLLDQVRPALQAHLDHARHVLASLP